MAETQERLDSENSKFEPQKRKVMRTPDGRELPVGRQKGVPNKVTRTIREAVERAARDCHPQGLAGWLIERANGTVQDRQIFAGLVAKALPLQVAHNVNGGITIAMPWLAQRAVSSAAQITQQHAQVIDAQEVCAIEHRINDQVTRPDVLVLEPQAEPRPARGADPPPPIEPVEGGG